MKRTLFVVMFLAAGAPASAETIRMEDVAVEGNVHKPQVVFITERTDQIPDRDGLTELKRNLLKNIVEDGRELAKEEAR